MKQPTNFTPDNITKFCTAGQEIEGDTANIQPGVTWKFVKFKFVYRIPFYLTPLTLIKQSIQFENLL